MNIYQHDFIVCPWCDSETGSRVDHLYGEKLPRSFGPWRCNECAMNFSGTVNAPGDVDLVKNDSKPHSPRAMSLLKFDGKNGPTFFVIEGTRYKDKIDYTDEDFQSHMKFLYEEHSCPTNWITECVAVIQNDDTDPHGFLEHVRSVEVSMDFDSDENEGWAALFPEAFEKIIDGNRQPLVIKSWPHH